MSVSDPFLKGLKSEIYNLLFAVIVLKSEKCYLNLQYLVNSFDCDRYTLGTLWLIGIG